jgi:choline dehydrogenase
VEARQTGSSRYDDLVVGGGTAGCVLAARLSEDADRAVCLVEAGPDYGPFDGGRWPTEMLEPRVLPRSHDWGTGAEDDRSLGARVIGGSSAHNACVMLAGTPGDYDSWGPAWRYEAFEPYLARAFAGLRTARASTETPTQFHIAFLEAARTHGFPLLADPNDPAQPVGIAPFPANVAEGVRWNTALGYLDAARGRPNLTIVAETLVDRLTFDDSRATGVVTQSSTVIEADRVVLAAGAYFSPAILLRSGIGSEAELRSHGVPVVAALPVGERLLDHCGYALAFEPTAELHDDLAASEPLFEAYVMLKASSTVCPPDTLDLHLAPWAGGRREEPGRYDVSVLVFLMQPRSTGRVRLRSTNPEDLPVVEHGFLSDPADMRPLLDGLELGRQLFATEPLHRLVQAELRPGPAEPRAFIREHLSTYYHVSGTCPIGAVVDEDGRVLGLENLVVADASIMPTIPRANTNLTVVAIAERIAELLRG